MHSPAFKNADSRRCLSSVSKSYSVVSRKISGSGLKRMVVPVAEDSPISLRS